MEKYLFGMIGALLLVIAGLGFYSVTRHPQQTANLAPAAVGAVSEAVQDVTGSTEDTNSITETATISETTQTQTSGMYTMAQIQAHDSASSCYTTIRGGVYDLTQWINQHPGGRQAILSLCGKDGTSAFIDQHGGQTRPENELVSLKIGILTK
jgi:cytochrome b involved in lipid metabolism